MQDSIFQVIQTADSIHIVFSSTLKNVDSVCEQTTSFLKSRVDDIKKQLFSINLVMREGLTNAVRHGNQNQPEKKVSFRLTLDKNQWVKLEIEDQGDGFDWKKQQRIIPDENDDHGRGFLIIERYFNAYRYNDKGNILYLEKDISDSRSGISKS